MFTRLAARQLLKMMLPVCTPVFIAALFTTAKTWRQPKCLSIGKG